MCVSKLPDLGVGFVVVVVLDNCCVIGQNSKRAWLAQPPATLRTCDWCIVDLVVTGTNFVLLLATSRKQIRISRFNLSTHTRLIPPALILSSVGLSRVSGVSVFSRCSSDGNSYFSYRSYLFACLFPSVHFHLYLLGRPPATPPPPPPKHPRERQVWCCEEGV